MASTHQEKKQKTQQKEPISSTRRKNHTANFNVEYMISYRYEHTSIKAPEQASEALEANFSKLIYALANAGLYSTVREGVRGTRDSTVLIFVRANKRRLIEEVYYSRVKDWLYGISYTASSSEESLESISRTSLTEEEKLRNVYHLIVHPVADGGAGITPGIGEWESVEKIFPVCVSLMSNRESWIKSSLMLLSKVFVLDLITSLLPILVTVFVYLPVGAYVLGRLDRSTLEELEGMGKTYGIDVIVTGILDVVDGLVRRLDTESLKGQIVWFAIIGQLINIINEMILPFHHPKTLRSSPKIKENGGGMNAGIKDSPLETAFLAKIRRQAQLDNTFPENTHHAGMACNQFSDLSLLSCIWPLTAVSLLLNDWLSLRNDVLKICHDMKRPIPCRLNDFTPWRHTLSLICTSSISCIAVLLHSFGPYNLSNSEYINAPWDIFAILSFFTAVVLEESLYIFTRFWIRRGLRYVDSSGLPEGNKHEIQYLHRKRLLEESFAKGVDVDEAIQSMEKDLDENINAESGNGNGDMGGGEGFWMTGGLEKGALKGTIRVAMEIFEKRRREGRGKSREPYKKLVFPRATRIPTTPNFKARQ